jgi:hypothetical protein
MKYTLILALLLSLCSLKIFAQFKPYPNTEDSAKIAQAMSFLQSQEHIPKGPQAVQSPNAANLGSYGEIAVSLYTGKPEINVNLHQVSDGEIIIPVSLSYDAAGIRPDQHPGWVGLNFNLSTNYLVTRTVRDGPDDNIAIASTLGEHGYAFNTALINNVDWSQTTGMKSIANATLNQILIDTEPDEFSFNAPGLSGKFYLGSDAKWKAQCDRPVKVQLINTGAALHPPFTPPAFTGNQWDDFNNHQYGQHFEGFIITDDFGNKYTFGGSDNSFMEYSMDFFNQGKSNWTCNAWYLKSIVRQTGQTTSFTYERGDFVAQMYFSIYNKMARINGGGLFPCANWSSLIGQMGPYGGKLISPIYLKQITSDNFKILFTFSISTELPYTQDIFDPYINGLSATVPGFAKRDYLTYLFDCFCPVNSGPANCNNPTVAQLIAKLKWRKLDKIQVQNGGGVVIKEFELTYNNVATERLMLLKVQEKSGYNVNKLPPYEFTYFTDALKLPGYCKSHTDHWGFNNGKPINVNTDYSAFDIYGFNFRNAAILENYYRLGSLVQIKYPTSGITKFWMEPHKYAKEVQLKRWDGEDVFAANQPAGGLRIKEIHSFDPASTDPVVVKKYYYLASFNAASPDTLANTLSSGVLGGKAQYYWPSYKPLPEDMNIVVEEDIFSTQSVLPASENSMGSHIGYSQVVERSSTEGWSVHKFSNFDNGYRDEAPSGFLQSSATPYQPYNNMGYTRGKELSLEHYHQNGNLASKTTQLFNLVGPLGDYSARSVKTLITLLCMTNNKVYEGTAYLIDVRKCLPIEVATYSYDQDNAVAGVPSIVTNTYWPNGNLDITGRNDSRGGSLKTGYRYAFNLGDPISLAMVAKNIVGPPREILNYTGLDVLPSPIKLTTIAYDVFNGSHLPQKVQLKYGISPAFYTGAEFLTYDLRGNLLTYREQNGPPVKLEYYGLGDIGKADLLKKRTLADGTSMAQSSSFNFKQLIGVETIQDPNGKTIFYDYDQFNRLKGVLNNNAAGAARSTFCYNYAGQVVECAAIAPVGSIGASTLVLLAEPALPVTLVAFTATKQENTTFLAWSTSSESNSDHFEVDRSKDGKEWKKIGSVVSHGESSQEQSYSYTDLLPLAGENLYRLKMVDLDSSFALSRIQSVVFDQTGELVVYPNPLTIGDKLSIQTTDPSKISLIRIFNANGELIKQSTWLPEINMSSLPSGLYMLQITFSDGSIVNRRIVKQ